MKAACDEFDAAELVSQGVVRGQKGWDNVGSGRE